MDKNMMRSTTQWLRGGAGKEGVEEEEKNDEGGGLRWQGAPWHSEVIVPVMMMMVVIFLHLI